MQDLILLRGQLVYTSDKLSQADAKDIKSDIVSLIDWGNGLV